MTRVLVIEDEKEIRESIIELLDMNGFEVQGASNGERALKIMQSIRPDVVLCDVMMDGLDGYGVLQTVRSSQEMADIPFIFLTALTTRDDMRYGMTLGADDYLTKPFSSDDLIDAIHARVARLNKTQGWLTQLQLQLINTICNQLNQPEAIIQEVVDSIIQRLQRMDDDDLMAFNVEPNLERLTKQLMLLAKLDTSMLSHEQVMKDGVVVNLRSAWMSAITEMKTVLENPTHVTIMTDENNLDAAVFGDECAIKEAFTEILINAFQYSPYNGIITVAQWATRDHAWFSVTDSGSGMSMEHVRLLLTDENYETGLGLTLAKRIAEVHGGDIRIDSAPNQGTIVAIRLPLAKVAVSAHS